MPHVRTRSIEWLLAILVLRHGRSVDRFRLGGTLWPESREEQALRNLRDILVPLRKALGPEAARIQSPTRDTLTLDLEGAEVDVRVFDAAIQAGDEGSLQRAVALHTGPLLEGCYEEWIGLERESREQACLTALETLATTAERRQDYAQALNLLQRAKGMDPFRDTTRRALMRVQAASGDAPTALHSYREYRLLLRGQMNMEPDQETTRLFEQIRTGSFETKGNRTKKKGEKEKDESTPPTENPSHHIPTSPDHSLPSSSLPHPLNTLIGREQEMREIMEALFHSRLVTLVGGGGVGKTRLAIQVARKFASDAGLEEAFVALASLSDPALLPACVATALGIREETSPDPDGLMQTLTGWFSRHETLLVLDNCEHVIEVAAALAQTLLERCPNLHILATSRQRLGLTGEIVWRVPSLPLPEMAQLPEGPSEALSASLRFPAIQLFVERATAANREFHLLRREELEAVCRICRQLDGIPLAIEMAAARVRSLTVEDIDARLDQRFRLLTGGSPTTLPRQKTLRSLIDWSYDLLAEAEKALLCRLSVFSGGWSLEAAEQVCSGDPVKAWEVLDLLTSLVDKSLVVAETSSVSVRYSLLETVRQYGRDRLPMSGERALWPERHQTYFLALAEEAEPHLRGPQQQAWLERLEREHHNLRAAMEGKEKTASLRIAGALWRFWHIRGHYSEGRTRLTETLKQAGEDADALVRAKALNAAGGLIATQGDYSSARLLFEESLAIGRESGNRQGIANALNSLGNVAYAQGDYISARPLFDESLTIQRELGNRQGIATALNSLSKIASAQGDYLFARPLFEESLAIQRELENRWGIADALNSLGYIAYFQGDYPSARAFSEESLAIGRELGDKGSVALSLNYLGIIAYEQGDSASAWTLLEESLAIGRESGHRWGIAEALIRLGNVASYQGEYASAGALFEESLAIQRELGNRKGITNSLTGLGHVAYLQGDHAPARTLFEECLIIQRETEDRWGIADSICSLGNIARDLGDYATARSLHEESLTIRQEMRFRLGIAESLEGIAGLVADLSNSAQAAGIWGAAERLREELGTSLPPSLRPRYEAQVAAARLSLGAARFASAWEEGRGMLLEQVIAYALS